MKSKIFLVLSLLLGLFFAKSVSALTLNNDGTYTNGKNAILTFDQYLKLSSVYHDKTIDQFSQSVIDGLSEYNQIIPQDQYAITTELIDNAGNVVSSITIPATEAEALAVTVNNNLHVLADGQLHNISSNELISINGYVNDWNYSTKSKKIRLTYNAINYGSEYVIATEAEWLKTPNTKSVDVLAVRWESSLSTSAPIDYEAYQETDVGTTYYSLGGTNMVRGNYGIGESMNLVDSASDFLLSMVIVMPNSVGDQVYATYQHATTGVLLSTSKSYTFGSSGLGGVLVYNPSYYASYYDNMNGVTDTLASGCHFDWCA